MFIFKCKGTQPGKQGFTLIELLVVIAIIAILAAIMFPVFNKARDSARRTQCLSNMKQMGIAFRMYMDDHADTFPLDTHSDRRNSWIDTLQPYVQSRLLYRCPSDTSNNWDAPNPNRRRQASYGTNFYMTPLGPFEDSSEGSHGFTKMSLFANPSGTIYIAEVARNSFTDHVHPAWWLDGRIQPHHEVNMKAHGDGSNYTFLDGHAVFMHFEQTFDLVREINLWDPY